MLQISILFLVLLIPATFWFYGKRLFGSQTHPAALFILAWMASAFLLNFVNVGNISRGAVALVWVTGSFAACAIAGKIRRNIKIDPEKENQEGKT